MPLINKLDSSSEEVIQFTMSNEYTVPKNLQYNFNGSTISFKPKPEYKAQSQNKLLKFNQLMKPNFQNIKKSQLERHNQKPAQNQVVKFIYKTNVKTPLNNSKYQPNSSYYKTLQQTQKHVIGLEKNIAERRHQSQLERFLAKQNQNLMEHRNFLTNQVRKYRSKAKNYRFKYHQYREKVRALEQQNQVWKMKFEEMRNFVSNSNIYSNRLESSNKKAKGFESTAIDHSEQEMFHSSKTGHFSHQKQTGSLEMSKIQMNLSQHYQPNYKSKASVLEQLNDQFQATMYDYKVRRDTNSRKKCIQLAKQIQMLTSAWKKDDDSVNKENQTIDSYNLMIIKKAQRFLSDESVYQVDQQEQHRRIEQNNMKVRQQLAELTQDQNKTAYKSSQYVQRNSIF